MPGYWGPSNSSCRCCHSGPKEKFWCRKCDHVCKAPTGWAPYCPHCRELMENMGHRWRPGPKGNRERNGKYPSQEQIRERWNRFRRPDYAGRDLLRKLLDPPRKPGR